jgi:hypothetical protein
MGTTHPSEQDHSQKDLTEELRFTQKPVRRRREQEVPNPPTEFRFAWGFASGARPLREIARVR